MYRKLLAGPVVGGPGAYWSSYDYDLTGNRVAEKSEMDLLARLNADLRGEAATVAARRWWSGSGAGSPHLTRSGQMQLT